MLKILCDTNQMAYGSSSALLAILKELKGKNTAFIHGVTAEILSTSELIHDTIMVDNKSLEKVKGNVNLTEYDAVIVVSNLTNVTWYLDNKIPTFYIDIHHWWHSNNDHRISKEAKKYFIENFFEQGRVSNNGINIGPLITLPTAKKAKKPIVLINIGGGENRWITPGVNSDYIKVMFNIVLEVKAKLQGYDFIIAAGKKSIDLIKEQAEINRIVAKTFNQTEYLEVLNNAEILLTSPGLNAIFEGIYYDCNVLFLPPQNASQILQLDYYEKVGIVNKGLNLTNFHPFEDIESLKFLGEETFTEQVLDALKHVQADKKSLKNIISHVIDQLDNLVANGNVKDLTKVKQILGNPGAKEVSYHIMFDLKKKINTTVVIPTKGERIAFLSNAITSVLQNSVLPKEIFIIVDNNTGSYKQITEIYQNISFIKVLHNTKKNGVSATRNFCISYISTDYISFLDDDDTWENTYLEEVFKKKNDITLVGFKKKIKNTITNEKLPPTFLKPNKFYVKNPGIRGSNITIKKSLFIKSKGFNEDLLSFNDMDFGIRLANLKNVKYLGIQKNLVVFNSHDGKRISTAKSTENIQGVNEFLDIHKSNMSHKEITDFKARATEIWGVNNFKIDK